MELDTKIKFDKIDLAFLVSPIEYRSAFFTTVDKELVEKVNFVLKQLEKNDVKVIVVEGGANEVGINLRKNTIKIESIYFNKKTTKHIRKIAEKKKPRILIFGGLLGLHREKKEIDENKILGGCVPAAAIRVFEILEKYKPEIFIIPELSIISSNDIDLKRKYKVIGRYIEETDKELNLTIAKKI